MNTDYILECYSKGICKISGLKLKIMEWIKSNISVGMSAICHNWDPVETLCHFKSKQSNLTGLVHAMHSNGPLHQVNFPEKISYSHSKTTSDWDNLTCFWTHFLGRFWICSGKFGILTIAPNMDKSVIGIAKWWFPLIGIVQLVFGPNLWGDSECEEGNLKFSFDQVFTILKFWSLKRINSLLN